ALGHVFFGQDGFIQAEFLHQGPLLGLADLHAQGLDLLGWRGLGSRRGFRLGFTLQVGLDVRQVGVVVELGLGLAFGLALGSGLGACGTLGLGGGLGRLGGFALGGALA